MASLPPSPFDRDRRNRRTLVAMAGIGLAMLGLGFASVPLYRIFCQTTGFGGTTQRAAADVKLTPVAGRTMSIRFDSNVQPGMPWEFRPEHRTDTVTVGARDMAIFIAKNLSDKPVTGTASFNVTPTQAGAYFTKIQCFCFTQQTLQPGEEVRMPVIYYVDPKILQDPDNKDTQQITLSYTFYPVEQGKQPS
ncbi:cytochrome c oxidase assembly protein [Sphingobium yanoikuyae]|jgi:cytochrome c oxidase assembly protein subunit 11|uniref:Cytochrome c oxidase assembly protein CtaG n=1 Tax=Sphingobium yanoikuyae TaxID=13690 RepID=A0A0J9D334_SPHYA|nr:MULTISPECIES: cytochrome c oxidase assembly protein [Sphingobium]ATP18171.1 cytochrome c oxidase assembly protein [Sphingobium yanoikuyae]KMW31564.1 cytochrome C oxidase assembly protein [Sphingobium yanoikuyae]MBR2270035.1 cytochrome c oxidase assembly protein [Sphingobium sp.]MBT2244782.1 cytochrome c oxidase assembly protein [Sphingobium sp. BHU LFT2]MDH2129954.1 cytochrome c oxidase assembly protein [Sphingobium yanoikuyae]